MHEPTAPTASRPRRTLRRIELVVAGLLVALLVVMGSDALNSVRETSRTTPRYDPPVLAGQWVPGLICTGGFYGRRGATIVLTVAEHCGAPGTIVRDPGGVVVGRLGPAAMSDTCSPERRCAVSDLSIIEMAPDRIPWGHLDQVDMGPGGYRAITPTTHPLACEEIRHGASVELSGRGHYRTGRVTDRAAFDVPGDIRFPCMVVSDIRGVSGDSGGLVFVDGSPAGIISRSMRGSVGFTPIGEGLAVLGIELCTEPDCGLTPATAEQPEF